MFKTAYSDCVVAQPAVRSSHAPKNLAADNYDGKSAIE
jgi:hypothetical protein